MPKENSNILKELKNMSFIDEMKNKAKSDIKTVVLPEANDVRVLEAASTVL